VFFVVPASAESDVNLYFFWGKGCPHCEKERALLEQFKNKYPYLKVYDFEVYQNYENTSLLQKIGKELDIRVDGVPFVIIGNKPISGFLETMTPAELADRIEYCHRKDCPDSVAEIVGIKEKDPNSPEVPKQPEEKGFFEDIRVRIIGGALLLVVGLLWMYRKK
jgi:thiol-disulfide isomerase/thioredoxin